MKSSIQFLNNSIVSPTKQTADFDYENVVDI